MPDIYSKYMDTTKFLITLPKELKARLKEHAIEKGLNLNAYIRMILTEKERIRVKADVAKQANATDSKAVGVKPLKVQFLPSAPKTSGLNQDKLNEIRDLIPRNEL